MGTARRHLAYIVCCILAACSPFTVPPTPTPPGLPTPQRQGTDWPPSDQTPSPLTLTLWVAPTFSPDRTTTEGTLLADRIDAFEAMAADIAVLVRVKEARGSSGLLETLTTASVAAPAALPDAIALDWLGLDVAARDGLLVRLGPDLSMPSSPEWHGYAVEVARIGDEFFGWPFASEADLFAFRSSAYEAPPLSWADLAAGEQTFLLPAADPTASFTMAQYLSLGGRLTDPGGEPAISTAILAQVLTFLSQSHAAGTLSSSARQESSATQTWQALKAGQVEAAVSPLSLFIREAPADLLAVPLPTEDGKGTSFAYTWSWAIVTPDPARRAKVSELIRWLGEPAFLGPWTRAMGLLPPTQQALAYWPDDAIRSAAGQIIAVGHPPPSGEVLSTLGPLLQQAVEAVLSGTATPDEAAEEVANGLGPNPQASDPMPSPGMSDLRLPSNP